VHVIHVRIDANYAGLCVEFGEMISRLCTFKIRKNQTQQAQYRRANDLPPAVAAPPTIALINRETLVVFERPFNRTLP
jgi:hypothetical protein